MSEWSGTNLHASDAGEAVFDRDSKVAGLLGLDKHLGGQLCKLIRCHAGKDIPIASVCDHAAVQGAYQHLARCG